MPTDTVLFFVYESSREWVNSETEGVHLSSEISSLLWFIARIKEVKIKDSNPLPPTREWIDLMLSQVSPHLPYLKGLPAKIKPVMSLLSLHPSEPLSHLTCSFIQSYYLAMVSLLPYIATDGKASSGFQWRPVRDSGLRESELKALLYDLNEAIEVLPLLMVLPAHLRPKRDFINLLLDSIFRALQHFLHLLSLRSKPIEGPLFVPASLLDVITTTHKMSGLGFIPNTAWFYEYCELTRPALARVDSLEALLKLSEAVESMSPSVRLTSGWYRDFCSAVERVISRDQLGDINVRQLKALRRCLKGINPLHSKKCLHLIKTRLSCIAPSTLPSTPSSNKKRLKSLIQDLSRSQGSQTLIMVDELLSLILGPKDPSSSGSVEEVTRGVGIAIKALSDFKKQSSIDLSLVHRLLSLASFTAPFMSVGQLSQAMLFSSHLDLSNKAQPWMEAASSSVAVALSNKSKVTVRDVSMILQATSRFEHCNDAVWMDYLLESVTIQLMLSQPLELVVLLSTLAYQKYLPCQPWVDIALSSIKSYLNDGQYHLRELSSIGASLVALGINPDILWVRSFIDASEVALQKSDQPVLGHQAIDHFIALAFLVNGEREQDGSRGDDGLTLRDRAQRTASRLVNPSLILQLTPGDLIRCLDSTWKLHLVPSPAIISAVLSRLQEMMRGDNLPNHLAMTIWQLLAYSKFLPNDEWLAAFASWSRPRFIPPSNITQSQLGLIDSLTSLQLVKILLSIARLGIDIQKFGPEWSCGCKHSLSHHIPRLNPSLQSQAAWSMTKTGIDTRGRVMRQLEKATAISASLKDADDSEKRIKMSPDQAANLLWSMQKSGYAPDTEYIEGLLSLFTPLLSPPDSSIEHRLTPRLLSLLSSSLAALRYTPRDSSFTMALMEQCREMRHTMCPQSLALCFRSLVTVNGHKAGEQWLVDMIESCVRLAAEFSEDEVGMICTSISECCLPKQPFTMEGEKDRQRGAAAIIIRPSQPRRFVSLKSGEGEVQIRTRKALISLSQSFSIKFTQSKRVKELSFLLTDLSALV